MEGTNAAGDCDRMGEMLGWVANIRFTSRRMSGSCFSQWENDFMRKHAVLVVRIPELRNVSVFLMIFLMIFDDALKTTDVHICISVSYLVPKVTVSFNLSLFERLRNDRKAKKEINL